MKKQDIIQICSDTIIGHRNEYETLKSRWNDLVERYENKLRKDSITAKTDSKVCLGGAFALVENALPRLLSRQPKYKYLGREADDAQVSELYDQFSDYQFNEAGVEDTLNEVVRWGLVAGLAGWKMGWKDEKQVVSKNGKDIMGMKVSNPIIIGLAEKIGIGKDVKVDETRDTSNYTFKAIKPHDLIWTTTAKDLSEVRVFGHTEWRYIKELKAEGYDTTQLVNFVKGTDKWLEYLKNNDGVSSYEQTKMAGQERVQVSELYAKIMNDQGYFESFMVTMANIEMGEPISVGFQKNPFDQQFMPMGIFRPIDRLGKFYGFGLVEPAEGVINAEEDNLNMALEAFRTDISRPMEYNPSNLIGKSISYGARVLLPVRQLGQSVAVLPTPKPDMNSVEIMQNFLNRTKQNVSGITDFQTGADQLQGAKTLGEIQIKTQESNARIGNMMRALERQVLEPMGRFALYMNQQFLVNNKKIFFRILGRKGQFLEKGIKFKDIEAVKDVIVISGSTALVNQQAELQKWSAFLNAAYQESGRPDAVPINREPAWERLIEQGMLEKDVETFLPNLKEREQQGAQSKTAQIEDAKSENANPITARVLPTDISEVHIPLHQAEIQVREQEVQMMQQSEQTDDRKIEELQILISHLNDHAQQSGGLVPPYSAGMQVGQGTSADMQQ